jgi:hypothetical protein
MENMAPTILSSTTWNMMPLHVKLEFNARLGFKKRELKRIGGSLMISIPKAMVRALDLAPDEKVSVLLTERGISILKKR